MIHRLKEIIYKRYDISFSRTGDDVQLNKLVNFVDPGVFVDVGCWHPIKASNTYRFYLRGWRGICIDPNPEIKKLFAKFRPTDTFLNCGVGDGEMNDLTYYQLEEAYSSMNTVDYRFLQKNGIVDKIEKEYRIPIFSLEEILDQHLSDGDNLGFFDVDVEGYDLQVLQTNNWERYRPKIIMVETDLTLPSDLKSDVTKYLRSVGYEIIAKSAVHWNLGNVFFMDESLKA
jgi:FkbM family methyltransferase